MTIEFGREETRGVETGPLSSHQCNTKTQQPVNSDERVKDGSSRRWNKRIKSGKTKEKMKVDGIRHTHTHTKRVEQPQHMTKYGGGPHA